MRTPLPLILGVALAACSRESPPPRPHAAQSLPAAGDRVTTGALHRVGGRLEYEATHRPTGTPRAEDVLAALAAAGVALAEHKQYLALTVKAAYCVGGQTAEGLSIAVCEYPTPADAAAGRAYVTERFRIPELDRVIHVRGATTLALGHHAAARLDDATGRAAAAFLAL